MREVSTLARKDLGPTPVGVTDEVTLGWVRNTYPSFSNYISTGEDLYLVLPEDPVEHQMELFEVYAAGSRIHVFIPDYVKATYGTHLGSTVESGKTAFFGLRWSSHAQAWFLLSATFQS